MRRGFGKRREMAEQIMLELLLYGKAYVVWPSGIWKVTMNAIGEVTYEWIKPSDPKPAKVVIDEISGWVDD